VYTCVSPCTCLCSYKCVHTSARLHTCSKENSIARALFFPFIFFSMCADTDARRKTLSLALSGHPHPHPHPHPPTPIPKPTPTPTPTATPTSAPRSLASARTHKRVGVSGAKVMIIIKNHTDVVSCSYAKAVPNKTKKHRCGGC